MEYLKAKINQLSEHTGLPEDVIEEQVDEDVEEGDVKAETVAGEETEKEAT
jgi:hypothetical protein